MPNSCRALQPNRSAAVGVCLGVCTCVSVSVGKEVSVEMEYNRQVPFGGAVAAEAAKAKNQTVEMRDMGFATVTIAEKDGGGQQRSSNVCSPAWLFSMSVVSD